MKLPVPLEIFHSSLKMSLPIPSILALVQGYHGRWFTLRLTVLSASSVPTLVTNIYTHSMVFPVISSGAMRRRTGAEPPWSVLRPLALGARSCLGLLFLACSVGSMMLDVEKGSTECVVILSEGNKHISGNFEVLRRVEISPVLIQ